jgi:intein-encoded DNA endonuclease-like protein
MITKEYGVNPRTVYAWTKGQSPIGSRSGRITYRKELFYVIGALLGDGCIYHWRNTFQIWLLGEPEFCAKFADMASRCTVHGRGKSAHCKPHPYPNRNVWFVRFQNAELYFLIKEIRANLTKLQELFKREGRSTNALLLIEGFFDAEGCVKVIKEPVRKTPKINIDFCNTNLPLLQLIGRELEATLRIEPHFTSQWISPERKVSYHLRIYKKEAIRKFLLRVHTIKLKAEKIRYVENWLEKNRKGRR